MIYDDEDPRIKESDVIAQSCASVSADDRCEAAFKIFQCTDEVVKAKGYQNGLLS